MLGKLLKAEMKATSRIFLPMLGLILVVSLIFSIFAFPGFFSSRTDVPEIVMLLVVLTYFLVVLGSVLATAIILIQRFYKQLLGDEGYLMFTLPVPTWQHIVTKGLIAMFWIFISMLAGLFSVLIITQTVNEIPDIFRSFIGYLVHTSQQIGIPAPLYLLELIFVYLVNLASGLLVVYSAIAIGHLWTKRRLLGSVGGFVGLQLVISLINYIVLRLFPTERFADRGVLSLSGLTFMDLVVGTNPSMLAQSLLNGVIGVGLFFLTNYILSHRLNLE